MANKYVKDLSENTSPASTDAVEIDDGVNSEYVTLANLVVGAVTPGTSGNVLTSNGTAWTSAAAGTISHGQCYLSKSSTNLLLAPFDGNKLIINSVIQSIPDTGVILAPPAVASTTYYIYAYMNGGTMTLEQSATAPAAQAGTGVQIKTGDATRTLVGMARTDAGNAWADSANQMFVISYYNRKGKSGVDSFSTNRTTTSGSYVELNTEIRIEFLTWADESVLCALGGYGSNNTTNGSNNTSFGFDGTTAEDTTSGAQAYTGGATVTYNLAYSKSGLAVGYHYVTVLGRAFGGTGTWNGAATAGDRVAQTIMIRG